MEFAERSYLALLQQGWTPQQARTVLPNSLKTEIVVTANIREWRTIFKQRTSKAAHPQMRELMCPLLIELTSILPELFEDIKTNNL
jgi:thymidylate synthase (FAD)